MTLQNLGLFLHHCAKAKALRRGVSLHAAAIKTGRLAETSMCNHILNFYAKCGLLHPAHQVFDEMPHRNLVTWSALISGYNLWDTPHKALQLFSEMHKHFKPNDSVFSSALSSCARSRDLNLGQQIHALALKLSYCSFSFVVNSLLLVYMKCGMCADALSVFCDSNFVQPTLVSYNIAITGLVESKLQEKGMELFVELLRRGLLPDRFSFAGLLGAGETVYGLSTVVQLHCQMVKLGLDCTSFSGNVLITLYSKFSLFQESDRAFRCIGEKDVVSWNTAIADCCRCEDHSKALDVFREMNTTPDDYTYASVLSAAASMASVRIGKEIHGRLMRTGPDWDVGVGNALVNMYAKCGYLTSGHTVFERMETRNLVSWNTMIAAFANHGQAEKGMAVLEEMKRTGVEPDSITFLQLLSACSHSGLADEGRVVLECMSRAHGIAPEMEHLCCVVDALGRAGRLSEAEEFIYSHKGVSDDEVVLGCLLSACRLHGDEGVGEGIAKRLIKDDDVAVGGWPYVLLSNLYAMNSKWDGVLRARRLVGLGKEAARSTLIHISKS
ncbi:pentatricopeptide repeat-containing protein At3g53360, mitochondrial-like [Salvia miltiorrhiza]|uniref:pentatricopeptide repeat-containing protein At3g53360, mitochondrial-like n=1 Tax=Salvia miltiorrhiza TaxID=226208 RepID=UPI0025AB8C42|nr:pentatricopeptide repeat-containing protein At3g53360, mitochondrial-like [Salvia miltiorrhiza]